VLVRLPLWPSAIEPPAVALKVGWAFSQTDCAGGGVARVADRDVALERFSDSSVKTCETRPMSL
jgi:hypothetical protein